MKPYSRDIRTKIIEAKNNTNESKRQLAERFRVSYSFVTRLLRRYDATNGGDRRCLHRFHHCYPY